MCQPLNQNLCSEFAALRTGAVQWLVTMKSNLSNLYTDWVEKINMEKVYNIKYFEALNNNLIIYARLSNCLSLDGNQKRKIKRNVAEVFLNSIAIKKAQVTPRAFEVFIKSKLIIGNKTKD